MIMCVGHTWNTHGYIVYSWRKYVGPSRLVWSADQNTGCMCFAFASCKALLFCHVPALCVRLRTDIAFAPCLHSPYTSAAPNCPPRVRHGTLHNLQYNSLSVSESEGPRHDQEALQKTPPRVLHVLISFTDKCPNQFPSRPC
jgi:hypothetical protein